MKRTDKIALISVTKNGRDLARRLSGLLPGSTVHVPRELSDGMAGEYPFDPPLSDRIAEIWKEYGSLIFIMATGIVVRVISGLLTDKRIDPAVLVVDEKGLHVISLLSGHLGGANALALQVAKRLGADPVITTATDLSGLPAVELWAGRMGFVIENPEAVKTVNAALVNGDRVGVFSRKREWLRDAGGSFIPYEALEELMASDCRAWVIVNNRRVRECEKNAKTLFLRPKNLVVGIGCNRGTGAEEILGFFRALFEERGLAVLSVGRIATIDLKQDETGLLEFAAGLGVPLAFYTRDQLNAMPDGSGPSRWAQNQLGVKGVCEQAAMKGGDTDSLLIPKAVSGNVTIAVAEAREVSLS